MPPETPTDASSRPVRADVTATATAGGVLVAVTLRNDAAVDVRVRVGNDLDGPVLPPRREGVPPAGWDEDGFTGAVPANGRLGIGYACPIPEGRDGDWAPSDSDPVSLEVLGPADEAEPPESDHVAAAVRSLGRATPPADAVPTSARVDVDRRPGQRAGSVGASHSDLPPQIAAWFDAVDGRIERAERLTDATADEAAAALADCGVDGVADLPDDLERDLASLRAAGNRIGELVRRAAAADPEPVVSSLVAATGRDAPAEANRGGGTTTRDAGREAVPDSGGER